MLILRCAGCKRKLWRYLKIGQGEVLRCHKSRIDKWFQDIAPEGDKILCQCGITVGIDKGRFIKMVRRGFTYSGTKDNA